MLRRRLRLLSGEGGVKRVLIVEDERIAARVASDACDKAGFVWTVVHKRADGATESKVETNAARIERIEQKVSNGQG